MDCLTRSSPIMTEKQKNIHFEKLESPDHFLTPVDFPPSTRLRRITARTVTERLCLMPLSGSSEGRTRCRQSTLALK
jgi:hypothetical protein